LKIVAAKSTLAVALATALCVSRTGLAQPKFDTVHLTTLDKKNN